MATESDASLRVLPRHLLHGSIEHLHGMDDNGEAGSNGGAPSEAGELDESPRRRNKLRYALGNGKILPSYMLAGSLEQLQRIGEMHYDGTGAEVSMVPLATDEDDEERGEGSRGDAYVRRVSPVPELIVHADIMVTEPDRLASHSSMPHSGEAGVLAATTYKTSQSSPALLTPSKGLLSSTPAPAEAAPNVAQSGNVSASPSMAFAPAPAPAPAQLLAVPGQKKRRPSKGSSMLNMLFHLGESASSSTSTSSLSDSTASLPGATAGSHDMPMSTEAATSSPPSSPFLSSKRSSVTMGSFLSKFNPLVRRRSQSSQTSSMSSLDGPRPNLEAIAEAPGSEEEDAAAPRS